MAHEIISREEAKRQGLKTYYTGKPCPRGHIAERFVTGKCVECNRERNKLRDRSKTGNVTGTAIAPMSKDWRFYVKRITAAWQKATEGILETGRLLIEAKTKLRHGEFQDMIESELPFTVSTAERLMKIASNSILSNPAHVQLLPPSWGTLYELTKLPEPVLLGKIEDHTVSPRMERKDATALVRETSGETIGKRRRSRPEIPTAQDDETEDLKAHIAELEAARQADVFVDDDDEPTLARKIVMVIGKERAALLIVELQKLINPRGEPNNGG